MAAGEPDPGLEARARRAYELGRLRAALRLAPLVLAAAGAAIVCGRPFPMTCALAVALLLLSVGLAYAGGSAGRAVYPGLLAGAAPLAAPLLMATVGHACFGPACASLGLPACILGGSPGSCSIRLCLSLGGLGICRIRFSLSPRRLSSRCIVLGPLFLAIRVVRLPLRFR